MNVVDRQWLTLKENINIGDVIQGSVVDVKPYGVYVDIGFQIQDGYKYAGIIDIASTKMNDVTPLPIEKENWPKINDKIECIVISFRERSLEVDLGWCA